MQSEDQIGELVRAYKKVIISGFGQDTLQTEEDSKNTDRLRDDKEQHTEEPNEIDPEKTKPKYPFNALNREFREKSQMKSPIDWMNILHEVRDDPNAMNLDDLPVGTD